VAFFLQPWNVLVFYIHIGSLNNTIGMFPILPLLVSPRIVGNTSKIACLFQRCIPYVVDTCGSTYVYPCLLLFQLTSNTMSVVDTRPLHVGVYHKELSPKIKQKKTNPETTQPTARKEEVQCQRYIKLPTQSLATMLADKKPIIVLMVESILGFTQRAE